MLDLKTLQTIHRDAIIEIGKKYGISNIRVFGSVVRGDNDENSDLDLLVDVAEEKNLFDIFDFCYEVEDLLGCHVDFVDSRVAGGKSPRLKEIILEEARPL